MEEQSMTAVETARLIDWLTQNGHTYEEACKCIDYIAAYKKPENDRTKKETPPPTK